MIRMKNSVDSKLKNSKDALSEKFLGHAGIHSIGLSNGHIVIFVEEPKSNEFRALFNRIKRAEDNDAVGLLFATTDDGSAFINPIEYVLNQLDIDIV